MSISYNFSKIQSSQDGPDWKLIFQTLDNWREDMLLELAAEQQALGQYLVLWL
ncbi:MAG: hypothetical protein LBB61_05955 [Treponema sp.]|nr:hypothetical protein [Treponema sp.]